MRKHKATALRRGRVEERIKSKDLIRHVWDKQLGDRGAVRAKGKQMLFYLPSRSLVWERALACLLRGL